MGRLSGTTPSEFPQRASWRTDDGQEKANLAKELNEKCTILAGVKDKTKAYVEKLNAEKASAVAALERQV